MSLPHLPRGARPAPIPACVEPQVLTSASEPPSGAGWLHEIKHGGHRVIAFLRKGRLRLQSRNGCDVTDKFGAALTGIAELASEAVLDGEITAPDERGVTHLDDLTDAIHKRRPERLAYFAFDLLHLDGHDLRGCALAGC
jgi:bifunctional non-homologous end joining protein LigD